jgi:tetratricopeptide (TPR) repeat protein
VAEHAPAGARRLALLGPLLIAAACVAAYWPCLHGGLLWDDDAHVTAARLLAPGGLRDIWLRLGATQQYYPVVHTAFWAENHLWGRAPLGYHLANVFLHALSACLFAHALCALRRGAGRPGAPEWLAAAVFALHPVCAESVAWISEQKNTLSLALYLLCALTYLKFDRTGRWRWYAAASLLFALALLAKSVTATLPFALLLVLGYREGRVPWRRSAPLVPWAAAAAAAGILTAWVERTLIGASGSDFGLGAPQRLVLAARATWFYLGKDLWPTGLMFIYPRWNVTTGWPWLASLAALAAAAAALWMLRRWSAAPLTAFLFFVGSLFPALGFVNVYPFRFSFVADHFQYIACLGIIALVAAGGLRLALSGTRTRARSAALACLCAAVLASLGFLTRLQAAHYADGETLYRAALASNPSAWMAENNLGVALMDRARYPEAAARFRSAIRLKADYADAHNNLGNALTKTPGSGAEALAEFREAIRLDPGMSQARANLGHELASSGSGLAEAESQLRAVLAAHPGDPEYAQAHADLGAVLAAGPAGLGPALAEFEEAVRLNPNLAPAWNSYGVALARAGRPAEAAPKLARALELQPQEGAVHNNLGGVLSQLGRDREAIAQYREAIRLGPSSSGAHLNLGRELRRAGRDDEALAELEEAARLDPGSAPARSSLGSLLYAKGRTAAALHEFSDAVRLDPSSASFRNNLGIALTAAGRLDDAVAQLRRAVELDPGYAEAHYNLAVALSRAGRSAEADAEFTASGRRP